MVNTNDVKRPSPFTTHRNKMADNLWTASYDPLSLWIKGKSLGRMFPDAGSRYISKAYILRGYKC
jgi:hypothetical protein